MKAIFKKTAAVVLSLLLGATTVFSFVGCGGGSGGNYTEAIDENRTQLYVYNYDGGFGSEWLSKVKARYEALHANDEYEPGTGKKGIQIMINNTKNAVTSETIKNGQDEVYFTENMYYYSLRYDGALADITEAVTGENPYEPEKTVESKFTDEQQNFYGIEGQREDGKTQYLGIPHYFGSYGIVYNKDLFDQKGYYFINGYDPEGPLEEKFIYYKDDTKTPGPDGISGNDDDGLPTTYQEFFWLCEYIGRVNNQVALSWTGQYYTQYLGFLLNALVADYEGLDQMMLNYTFKGSATDLGTVSGGTFREDAQDLEINESNGWNLKRQRGVYEALSFIETLVDTPTYRNGDNAFNDSYSHLNNQEDFLMSRADGVTTPIAMTVDGMWWQSESSHVFSSMASRYGAQYSQENSELRWMPLPKATEEKAQEATENIKQGKAGNTIADSLYSLCFVSSGIDDWKLPIAVDFIQFCNTDESLLEFTTTTNTMKALSYEIGDDVLEQLSPYGQSLVGFIRNADIVYPYSSSEKYINNASMFRADTYYRATVNGATANFPAQAFHVDGVSAADYFAGMATYYERTWSTLN